MKSSANRNTPVDAGSPAGTDDHVSLQLQPRNPPAGGRIVRALLRGLLRLLFRVGIHGDTTVFQNERTLIVANHESFLDGLLLGVFLPVAATFVVHTEVTKSAWVRWSLRFVPHLVVDSTNPMAIKLICRLVESGTPVVIFPEGRLTVTGSLMKVYDGAGFVAARTGATVVPVRIEGAGRSYFGRLAGIYPLKLFPKISVTIRPPPKHTDAEAAFREAASTARRRAAAADPPRHAGGDPPAAHLVPGIPRRQSDVRRRGIGWSRMCACRRSRTGRCCACR